MSTDVTYLSIDTLTMLSVGGQFDVRLLRLYLALGASSLTSSSAQEYAYIGQPKRYLDKMGLAGITDKWRVLDHYLGRLERVGLATREISPEEWVAATETLNQADETKQRISSTDRCLVKILDPNGGPHTRRAPKRTKYIHFIQSSVKDLFALADGELVLLLLLLSAVRLPAFGGVDQDTASNNGKRVNFGRVLKEAYEASMPTPRYGTNTAIEKSFKSLVEKGYFVWVTVDMMKVARYKNTWVLKHSWERPPRRGGDQTVLGERQVLVPQKALGLHTPDVCFINALTRGELTNRIPFEVIGNLQKLAIHHDSSNEPLTRDDPKNLHRNPSQTHEGMPS